MEIDLTISNYVKNLSDNDMGSLPDAQFRCWVFQTPHKDLGVFQQSLYIYPTFPPIYQTPHKDLGVFQQSLYICCRISELSISIVRLFFQIWKNKGTRNC
jgi:hypothetical protein